jgi:hypothetical protein
MNNNKQWLKIVAGLLSKQPKQRLAALDTRIDIWDSKSKSTRTIKVREIPNEL